MDREGVEQSPPPEVLAEISDVAARARGGDVAAVPRLREFFASYPLLWEHYGDLAAQAEMAWIALAAGNDLHMKESLVEFTARQRATLTRPSASPVETLLVERAVACWLQLQYFTASEATAVANGESPRLLQYRARRQAQAQRLYETALAALVTIQKLFPAVADEAVSTGPRDPAAARDGRAVAVCYADAS